MAIQIDMIGIVVTDMAESLRFYRQLGLAIPDGMDEEPHVEVITENGYRIAFDSQQMIRAIDTNYVNPIGYRTEIAFKCDTPEEVDRVYAELSASGYNGYKAPWDAFWGQRYAQIDDPDGNHVSLFAALPATS